MREIAAYTEGFSFIRLNFPDPFGYGAEYKPISPPRHHAMKAVMDNISETVEKVYVYGSSIRLDSATDSDLDIFILGSLTSSELNNIYRAIPADEKVDILVETAEEFSAHLDDNRNSLYQRVYEGGYKIYERQDV